MRGFDCVAPDGTHSDTIHFEAETDEGILAKAKAHAATVHSGLGMTEQQLRDAIANASYEMVHRTPTAKD